MKRHRCIDWNEIFLKPRKNQRQENVNIKDTRNEFEMIVSRLNIGYERNIAINWEDFTRGIGTFKDTHALIQGLSKEAFKNQRWIYIKERGFSDEAYKNQKNIYIDWKDLCRGLETNEDAIAQTKGASHWGLEKLAFTWTSFEEKSFRGLVTVINWWVCDAFPLFYALRLRGWTDQGPESLIVSWVFVYHILSLLYTWGHEQTAWVFNTYVYV